MVIYTRRAHRRVVEVTISQLKHPCVLAEYIFNVLVPCSDWSALRGRFVCVFDPLRIIYLFSFFFFKKCVKIYLYFEKLRKK